MLFALLLPVLLALGAIVLDVGNWYVHKKHLQTLVDAGAFAGATKFVGCSFQFGDPVAANHAITATALEYAGDTSRAPAPAIDRSGAERRACRPEQRRATGPGDPTRRQSASTTRSTTTATDGGRSVQLANAGRQGDRRRRPVPLGLLPLEVGPEEQGDESRSAGQSNRSGMLPWAVPEVEPAAVAAIFVDENTGNVTAAAAALQRRGLTPACRRPMTSSPTGARPWATTWSISSARTPALSSSSRR